MIGVDDLLGRHYNNIPDSVYIDKNLSGEGRYAGCVPRGTAAQFIQPDNSPENTTRWYWYSDGASILVQQAAAGR